MQLLRTYPNRHPGYPFAPDGERSVARAYAKALTRARRHLFVVGDSATLSSHAFYARLIESIQAGGGYRSAWEWPDAT